MQARRSMPLRHQAVQAKLAGHGRTKEIAREEKSALTIIPQTREDAKRRQKARAGAKAKEMVPHPEAHRRPAEVQEVDHKGIDPIPTVLQGHPRTDPPRKAKERAREKEREVARAKRAKVTPRFAKHT